jgi:DNA polymerase-1
LYYLQNKSISDFRALLEAPKINKYFADSKKIFRMALQNDIEIRNTAFDFRLAAYVLNPNASSYSLTDIAMSYRIPLPEIKTETELPPDITLLLKGAAAVMPLYKRLVSLLEENNQLELLTEMEIPLAEVLASMEEEGMEVNRENIESYSVVLSGRISELEQEIYSSAGEAFNINSPKQLGVILFEKLGIPAKKKTKTGYSTNAEVLEELADDYPIVSKILEYRTYAKLKSTYCDGLLKAIGEDGRIHSTFNQTETRTGRLSSTEPNLQNIPVRTQLGREFRKFFTARDGYYLVDADYSQIELRVLAALADDKNMTECFNTGVDVHTVTAAKVFGVPESEVTPELRSKAKAVNFGIVYGIGAFSLAKDIHSTRAEAEQFINAYLALYSSINGYMQNAIKTAKEKGYAETLFHRRRYLPELTSSNGGLRAFGERVARNMPIQGTAADIIKIAMIKVYRRLENELPQAKLIMQVHDELILEAPVMLAQKAAEILKEEMENAVRLSVKLSAEAGVGKTWYEAKA